MSLFIDVVKRAQGKPIVKVDNYTKNLRVSICEDCPFMQVGIFRTCGEFLVGGKVNYRGEEKELCGCNIDDKANYKDDHCPLGKW